MKYIKTFENFINENNSSVDNNLDLNEGSNDKKYKNFVEVGARDAQMMAYRFHDFFKNEFESNTFGNPDKREGTNIYVFNNKKDVEFAISILRDGGVTIHDTDINIKGRSTDIVTVGDEYRNRKK